MIEAVPYPENWSTTPGVYSGIPEDVYHADRGAVSNSTLKLIDLSPKQCRHSLDHGRDPTTPMRLGRLVHAMVLEPLTVTDRFWQMPEFSPTGAAATKNKRASWWPSWEAEAAGREIMSCGEWQQAADLARAAIESQDWIWLLEGASIETVLVWQDDAAFREMLGWSMGDTKDPAGEPTGLYCRARVDIRRPWNHNQAVYADPKTAADPFEHGFSAAIARYDYDVQAAFYTDGGRACGEDVYLFVFPVVQKEPPHETMTYQITDADLEAGRTAYLRRLALFAKCQAENHWPSRSAMTASRGGDEFIHPISRAWARRDYDEEPQQ